jgi:prepilin-type N-terminal cleavage/methylation domain-containing protein
MRRKFRSERGFTLLELLISMVILSIAFLGILPFFFYSQAKLKDATLTNLALSLIEEKMERITNLGYELINYQDNPWGDVNTQYTYILPEVNIPPCSTYHPNPCGYQGTWTKKQLMDICRLPRNLPPDSKDGYFFTRYIDIDQPDIPDSWDDPIDPGLPSDHQTLRVTITVLWNVPGGKQHFVQATTYKTDVETDQL